MYPTDKQIISAAKEHGEQKSPESFCDLVHSKKSRGVNSAFGIGFIEGAVWCRGQIGNGITVKDIAEMQRYIDKLEETIWFLYRFSKGKDGIQSVVNTFDDNSATAMAFEGLYDFIKEHKEEEK